MKKQYQTPEIGFFPFAVSDFLITSGEDQEGGWGPINHFNKSQS